MFIGPVGKGVYAIMHVEQQMDILAEINSWYLSLLNGFPRLKSPFVSNTWEVGALHDSLEMPL